MIYLDELDQSFDTFDDLLYWFCSDFPAEEDIIGKEAEAFIKHHFPLINLSKFWVSVTLLPAYDADFKYFRYNEISIDYNKSELKHHYPEYFI